MILHSIVFLCCLKQPTCNKVIFEYLQLCGQIQFSGNWSFFQELFECSAVLEAIFDNKKTVKADEVTLYNSTLLAWALLLSVTPERQAVVLINKWVKSTLL